MNLNAKRALLIAPKYFNYEHEIASEIEKHGFEIDVLPDPPLDNSFGKMWIRYAPLLGAIKCADLFYRQKVQYFGRSNYDLILVILGAGVSKNTLIELKKNYPKARLTYYTWDSIDNKPQFKNNLKYYDFCYSFDPIDAKKYSMNYRPLFYSSEFAKQKSTKYLYDLSFIGTIHSDRYKIIKNIEEQLHKKRNFYYYLFIQAPWVYYFRKIFTGSISGASRSQFNYKPLEKKIVSNVFQASKAVLDIEHPNQNGATVRTFEAIGSQRKIITTNQSLKNMDFFSKENIHIINRKNPQINESFFDQPFTPLSMVLKKKYSLKAWVADVCGF